LLVLEYADSGTLRNYLKNNFNKLNWNVKLQFAIQITDAVSYIHRNDIIHRDLVSIFYRKTSNSHALMHILIRLFKISILVIY
jgi:serine/threonine protein kinase